MQSLLKNLKKHVECSICLDSFTEPKTIACLHTFCCECLKKHALLSQKEGQFRCPECQAQIGIPKGNRFDQLPTSFHHNSLLSLLAVQQSGDGSEISCGFCKKKSAEISYCFDCEKLLCSDCLNAHEVFKTAAFQGHKVTPVKQFQAEDYEALLKRKAFCSQKYHEREVTRFYCRACQTSICQICIVTDHKNHEIEPLEKAADDERANILAGAELMKQKHEACSDVIRQFEEIVASLETNIAAAKRQVSRAAEQMIAAIHESEREAITTLENTRLSRMEKLNAAKKQVEMLKKQINRAAEFANDLAQRSSSADIMQNKRNLEERFDELDKSALPAFPVGPFIKFISTCTPDNASLGFISETDPNRSIMEGLLQNYQAGVEAEIFICLKTYEGQIINTQHKDLVEVLVEPADQLASLMINEESGGNFKVKFVPRLPGAYYISAKINGESLAQSPFTIAVQERRLELVGELDLQNKTMKGPSGIAVNSKGLIAVADRGKNCILIFDEERRYVRVLGCYGKNPGEMNSPVDVTFMNDDEILVTEECNHRIQLFNVHNGKYVKGFGKFGTGDGEFKNPAGVCMDGEGHVVVAEYINNRVQVLTKDGAPLLKFGDSGPEKLNHPLSCIYYKNMFIVTDSENCCLKLFDSSGRFLYKMREKGEADKQFTRPWGLCVDKHGSILVSDCTSGHVQQFTIEGRFTGKTVAKLQSPCGITIMPDGRILISDFSAKKVFILK